MSACLLRKQVREPRVESFEDATCLTLDLINIIKQSPLSYRPPLTLLLVLNTGNEHELAVSLKIPQARVKRAKRYLRQALIEVDAV